MATCCKPIGEEDILGRNVLVLLVDPLLHFLLEVQLRLSGSRVCGRRGDVGEVLQVVDVELIDEAPGLPVDRGSRLVPNFRVAASSSRRTPALLSPGR